MTREEREKVVDWFTEQLKATLRVPKNEAKGGWRNDSPRELMDHLRQEVEELSFELKLFHLTVAADPDDTFRAIIAEACDVAALAMMVADLANQQLLTGKRDEI